MTAQVHEVLILDGERTSMAFCPPLPAGDPRYDFTFEWTLQTAAKRIVQKASKEGFALACKLRDGHHCSKAEEEPGPSEVEISNRERELTEALRAEYITATLSRSPLGSRIGEHEEPPTLPPGTTEERLQRAVASLLARKTRIMANSACWRGYRGTWEIRENALYLVEVTGFPEYRDKPPILADWFTGVLRIPRGKQLVGFHMGFGALYEEELHIKIEKGLVTARRTLTAGEIASRVNPLDWMARSLPGSENWFPGDDEM